MTLKTACTNYYKCDETSGTTMTDAQGSDDGTISGATVNQTGKIEKCYSYVTNDDVDIGTPLIAATGAFTVNAWVKTPIVASGKGVFAQFASGNGGRLILSLQNSGKIIFQVGNQYIITTENHPDDVWFMVTYTRDASNNCAIYINGVSKKTGTISNSILQVNSYIGSLNGATYFMDGEIDEVAIFAGTDIGSAGVTELYNGGDGLAYPFTTGPSVKTFNIDDTATLNDELTITRNTKTFNFDLDDTATLSDKLVIGKSINILSFDTNDTATLSDELTINKSSGSYIFSLDDTATLSDVLTISRNSKSFTFDLENTATLSDVLTITKASNIKVLNLSDSISLTDEFEYTRSKKILTFSIDDSFNLNELLDMSTVIKASGVQLQVSIGGVIQYDIKSCVVESSQNEFDTSSNFTINFDNVTGEHSDSFSINQEVEIKADVDKNPSTVLLNGVIEDIDFSGRELKEVLTVSGREYGSILQDVLIRPRIFKDTEVSAIINSIMSQNITSISTNNVNVTSTTIDKITFTNMSVFDALKQLAEISGYYFYVDSDKDLHFEQKNTTSSGFTMNSENVTSAKFRTTDQDRYTKVTVQGDRQLTGAESIQTTGTDNTGSVYILDAKPYNTQVILSGASDTILQPGGVLNIDDPATDNVKYLVDFQSQKVILTSGTTAGDNVQATGSVVKFQYNRSTPVISVKEISSNFPKHKILTDRNIKDINEASTKAQSFLDDHKDSKIDGRMQVQGLLDVTPGNTVLVNLPNHGQDNQTYAITNAKYEFNPTNMQSERILSLNLNQDTTDFVGIMKEQILRLRAIESSETDSSITSLELGSSIIGVRETNQLISTGIGSGFFFNVPNHDIFNSPSSLLGDMRGGSTVFENGVKL